MLFSKVFKALNKSRVRYVVAGGAAVVLYGYPRFTGDLDLIVDLEERNLEKFYDALTAISYFPKVPVTRDQLKDKQMRDKWRREKGMVVFSFVHKNPPFEIVDMFIDEPIKFQDIYKQRKIIRIDNVRVPLIGIDHLIKLKQKADRLKDREDVAQLKAVKRKAL